MNFIRKTFALLLRISITVALLIFLFRQVDVHSLLSVIRRSDKLILLGALFVFSFNYFLCFWRWKMLLKAVAIHLPSRRIITSFAGSVFFNVFLPSTIGGDLVRSADLAVHTKKPAEVVATVLLDRLSGYVGLVIVTLLALLFGWRFVQDRGVVLPVAIITGVLCLALLVLFNSFFFSKINQLLHSPTAGRIRELFTDLHKEVHFFKHHKGTIGKNLALSILIQIVAPITNYVIALALGIKIHIAYFFVFLPIIGAISLLPISIGGLGLRDASTIYFFSKAAVPKDLSFAMSLIGFFFLLVYAAIGGLIYVLTIHHRRV